MSIPIAGSSKEGNDYTEGASSQDVQDVITNVRRVRRDSEYSSYDDDPNGGMYCASILFLFYRLHTVRLWRHVFWTRARRQP